MLVVVRIKVSNILYDAACFDIFHGSNMECRMSPTFCCFEIVEYVEGFYVFMEEPMIFLRLFLTLL